MCAMGADPHTAPELRDPWIERFLQHLTTERGASVYTQRNYKQALLEFLAWHQNERGGPLVWAKLVRDDFRAYLRSMGRRNLGRAPIQLRFSALRSFYKYLVRLGRMEASPIRDLVLPRTGKRLPKFLTREQMEKLLHAPLKLAPDCVGSEAEERVARVLCFRDAAILEELYS